MAKHCVPVHIWSVEIDGGYAFVAINNSPKNCEKENVIFGAAF